MFITKKALQRRIEEEIAKDRERASIDARFENCVRDFMQEIKWLRQDYGRMFAGMDARICKLEGKNPDEVKVYENA